jgi:hypothetical protein
LHFRSHRQLLIVIINLRHLLRIVVLSHRHRRQFIHGQVFRLVVLVQISENGPRCKIYKTYAFHVPRHIENLFSVKLPDIALNDRLGLTKLVKSYLAIATVVDVREHLVVQDELSQGSHK